MKQNTIVLFGAILLSISLPASAGLVLINDDFSDGNTAGWTVNGGTTTLTVQNDTSGIGDGNAMKYTTTGKNNMWSELAFTQSVTLGLNDSISLAMDVRFTGDRNSPPNLNNAIRWMFMTTGDVMTGIGINAGGDAAQGSWFQVGTVRQDAKFQSINLGTAAHNIVLTVTRKDDGAGSYLQFSYALDGGTAFIRNGSVIASPTTEFSFDSILLGSSGIDDLSGTQGFDGVLYDNVTVTTSIPEPATIGILGLGAALTILSRRFRG